MCIMHTILCHCLLSHTHDTRRYEEQGDRDAWSRTFSRGADVLPLGPGLGQS